MSRCRVADPQLARLGLTLHHSETCISPAAAPFPAEKVPFAHLPQSDLLFIGACPAEIPPRSWRSLRLSHSLMGSFWQPCL